MVRARTKRKSSAALLLLVLTPYVITGRLGLLLDPVGGFATLVWAPTGIAIFAVARLGYAAAPAIFLAALLTNVLAGAPLGVAIGIALGNTLEALLAGWSLKRLGGFERSFDRLAHVFALLVPGALVATAVSATVGVTSLGLGGVITSDKIATAWRTWWVGDVLGALLVAPLLLAWASARELVMTRARIWEAAALGSLLFAATGAVFFDGSKHLPSSPILLFPLFVWAAVRFELRGATATTAIASALATWGTIRGNGPFAKETLNESLFALQTFMASVAVTPLIVAGAISERSRAVRVREAFVATVSHDLRSPLSVIRMSADALTTSDRVPSPERIEKHARVVVRNVDRMTRLIQDLLDASAIDAGRFTIDSREEDTRSMLAEAVDLQLPITSAKKQELVVATAEGVTVSCDRARVLQVLSNLIDNASKFSPSGKRITVGVVCEPRSVRFWVTDSGVGVEPAQLTRIFERHWHTAKKGGGTGLGLFIAKGLVEAHGGTLWAESTVGTGSTFQFRLPLPATPRQRRLSSSPAKLALPSVSEGENSVDSAGVV
jgi:signal transduction histidine kinase